MPVVACPHCRQQMTVPAASGGMTYRCPGCKAPLRMPGGQPPPALPPVPPLPQPSPPRKPRSRSASGERVFLDEDDVLVTNARVVVPAQTFALALITSVRPDEDKKISENIGGVAVAILILAAILWWGAEQHTAAIVFAILGVIVGVVAVLIGPLHLVMFVTAAHEVRAVTTWNKAFAARVIAAINEAIVFRG